MDAAAFRQWLVAGACPAADCDGFDIHVLASILALAAGEAGPGGCIAWRAGLDNAELAALAGAIFPHATAILVPAGASDGPVPRTEDEDVLFDLLWRGSTAATPLQRRLAAMLARRAQQPNHLWQDLGLDDRSELSRLMQRHFAPLAMRNSKDMKWKKFLYRMICRDSDYSLCTAPSCAECDDFAVCFGDESGESLLARSRRTAELAAQPAR